MSKRASTQDVFINCPFDDAYRPLFDAIVFTVFDSGFVARCALEVDDGGQVRIDKIFRIIDECRFGIHDISRTELDRHTGLPRFNMPLELGMFLGVRRFGGASHGRKVCLILDNEQYRYQQYISDIAGQDIKAHKGQPQRVVSLIRDWLNASSGRLTIPGGKQIWKRYQQYQLDLPEICENVGLALDEVTFNDTANFISEWLRENT